MQFHFRFLLLAVTAFSGCSQAPSPEPSNQGEVVVAESNQAESNDEGSVLQAANGSEEASSLPSDVVLQNSEGSSPAQVSDGVRPDLSVQESQSFRLPRVRTAPSPEVLSQHGLRRIESRRLVLITDSDDPSLDLIPPLADRLFDELQSWFGELLPAEDGSEFQVLGFIMVDRARFRAADLMPDESFSILHGRHLRYSFWAGYPEMAYYRRHLALHEFVHCFMTCENTDLSWPPPWYIEGMAELFATHQFDSSKNVSSARFAVMPKQPTGFEGWGRIRAFRLGFENADHNDLQTLSIPSLDVVVPNSSGLFQTTNQYASSWAMCWFLKHHPEARAAMEALSKERAYVYFLTEWERWRNDLGPRLAIDWLLFSEQLDFDFDAERAFPVHRKQTVRFSDQAEASAEMVVHADRGWQDSGIPLQSGQTVQLQCEGRCVVNRTSIPWETTPNGISVQYYRGHRLGRVVGVVVSDDGQRISDRLSVGREGSVTASFAGRLWLQVNDSSGSRANNSGQFMVTVKAEL